MNIDVKEHPGLALSGWIALIIWLIGMALILWTAGRTLFDEHNFPLWIIPSLAMMAFLLRGFVILDPNIAAVLVFFGRYSGTLRDNGFYYYNPFCSCRKLSLRVSNLNTPALKVNDRAGNPIEVAAVVAWRVSDTVRAVFDVEDFNSFLIVQCESAIRQVASTRWYDGDHNGQESLRGDLDAVAKSLADTIQSHVELAGLEIVEAKIAHLAYAPEIAGAMLRRQQAEAIIAARARIVEGAVGMVRLALDQLRDEGVVELSPSERVQLVCNLLTVLVSESETQPVLPIGRS